MPKGDLLVQCYGKISDRDDVVSKLRALDLEIGARLDKTELEKVFITIENDVGGRKMGRPSNSLVLLFLDFLSLCSCNKTE